MMREGEEPPEDTDRVTEGVELLHDLTAVASACVLLGVIHALNLAYPNPLHFTFKVFQKVFMQLEQHNVSPKVQRLFGRLQCMYCERWCTVPKDKFVFD